ncbi:hypothetical protein [Candidatus Tisiphia endosymbiont of Beris chalybata]|uniref:hypothetical protein n=1 Tax=Candidatus Tisiphia endosymbiont of Beris chalybata TaxID=3066262 RepID=UPI00312C9E7D
MPTVDIDILGEIVEICALEDSLKKHKLIGEAQELTPALLNLSVELQKAILPDEKIEIVKKQLTNITDIIDQTIGIRYQFSGKLDVLERAKISLELEEIKPAAVIVDPEISTRKIASYDRKIGEIEAEINLCQDSIGDCENILFNSQQGQVLLERDLDSKKTQLAKAEKDLEASYQLNYYELANLNSKHDEALFFLQQEAKSKFVAALEHNKEVIQEKLRKLEEEQDGFEKLLEKQRQEHMILQQIQNGAKRLSEDLQLKLDQAGGIMEALNVYDEQINNLQYTMEELDKKIGDVTLEELEVTKNLDNIDSIVENNYLSDPEIEAQWQAKKQELERIRNRIIVERDAEMQEAKNAIWEQQKGIPTIQQKICNNEADIKEGELNLEHFREKLRELEKEKQEVLQKKALLKEQLKEEKEANRALDTSDDSNLSLTALNKEIYKLRDNIEHIEEMVCKQGALLQRLEGLLDKLSLSKREMETDEQNPYMTPSISRSSPLEEEVSLKELAEAKAAIFNVENNNSKTETLRDIIAADEGFESDIGGKEGTRKQDTLLLDGNFSSDEQEEDIGAQDIDEQDIEEQKRDEQNIDEQERDESDYLSDLLRNATSAGNLYDESIVNSGEFGARSDGATLYNRQALSDDVTNFSSIDYSLKSSPTLEYPAVWSSKSPANYQLDASYERGLMNSTLVAEEATDQNLGEEVLILSDRATPVDDAKTYEDAEPPPKLLVGEEDYDPRAVIIPDEGFESDIGGKEGIRKQDTLLLDDHLSSNDEQEENIDEQSIDEQSIDEQSIDEQSIDEQSIDEQSIDEQSIDEQSIDEQNIDEQNIDEQNIDEQNIDESDDLRDSTLIAEEAADQDLGDEVGAINSPSSLEQYPNIVKEEVVGVKDNTAQIVHSVAIAPAEELTVEVEPKVEVDLVAIEPTLPEVVYSDDSMHRSVQPEMSTGRSKRIKRDLNAPEFYEDNSANHENLASNIAMDIIVVPTNEPVNLVREGAEPVPFKRSPSSLVAARDLASERTPVSAETTSPPLSQYRAQINPPSKMVTLYYSATKIDEITNRGESSNSLGVVNGLLKIMAPNRDNEANGSVTKTNLRAPEDKIPMSKINPPIFANNHLNENGAISNKQLNGNQIIQNNMATPLINNTFPLGGQVDFLLPILPFIFMQTHKDKWINRMNRRKHKNIILTTRHSISISG